MQEPCPIRRRVACIDKWLQGWEVFPSLLPLLPFVVHSPVFWIWLGTDVMPRHKQEHTLSMSCREATVVQRKWPSLKLLNLQHNLLIVVAAMSHDQRWWRGREFAYLLPLSPSLAWFDVALDHGDKSYGYTILPSLPCPRRRSDHRSLLVSEAPS